MKDKAMYELLKQATDNAENMKKNVWNNLLAEMNLEDEKVRRMKKTSKRRIYSAALAAAAIMLVVMLATEPGQAAMKKIWEIFVPEKEVETELEGMPEEIEVELEVSKMGYVIYIDTERYEMVKLDGTDRIQSTFSTEGMTDEQKEYYDNLPKVYMDITQHEEITASEMKYTILDELNDSFENVFDKGHVTVPLDAEMIYAYAGLDASDKYIKYYIVDNTNGGCFVIRQQYFIEAEEGHGARLDNMLKDFEIVPAEMTE